VILILGYRNRATVSGSADGVVLVIAVAILGSATGFGIDAY